MPKIWSFRGTTVKGGEGRRSVVGSVCGDGVWVGGGGAWGLAGAGAQDARASMRCPKSRMRSGWLSIVPRQVGAPQRHLQPGHPRVSRFVANFNTKR